MIFIVIVVGLVFCFLGLFGCFFSEKNIVVTYISLHVSVPCGSVASGI